MRLRGAHSLSVMPLPWLSIAHPHKLLTFNNYVHELTNARTLFPPQSDLLQWFYETTLDALQDAKNDRLWFKTNTKVYNYIGESVLVQCVEGVVYYPWLLLELFIWCCI